jgi:hypothetical protein
MVDGPDLTALRGPGAFADDDGSTPVEVAEVLARRAQGGAGQRELVTTLGRHRLLVPLLEVDAGLLDDDDADPCAGQDRAVAAVSIRTDQGIVGLAFTGMESLQAWDAAARPMPVEAPRVASAVLAEGGVALLIDPAGPVPARLEGIALGRLATAATWPEPWVDPAVQQAVVAELTPVLASGELKVRLAAPAESDPVGAPVIGTDGAGPAGAGGLDGAAQLVVEVQFGARMEADLATQRAAIIARRLGASDDLRQVFDGVLAVRLVTTQA